MKRKNIDNDTNNNSNNKNQSHCYDDDDEPSFNKDSDTLPFATMGHFCLRFEVPCLFLFYLMKTPFRNISE